MGDKHMQHREKYNLFFPENKTWMYNKFYIEKYFPKTLLTRNYEKIKNFNFK